MRLSTAIRAGVLSAILLAGLDRPAGAQPPPPPVSPRPAAPAVPVGQPRDPGRRPPPEPVGTGVIRGMVVAADSGTPIRRANVNLMPMPVPIVQGTGPAGAVPAGGRGGQISVQSSMMMARPRSMTTDAQGAFAFTGLPAGSYRVMASPGQYTAGYLSMNFGAKRPNGPTAGDQGQIIQLGDGQAFEKATISLPRGAVITGRVTDESGDPLARVQVYTIFYPPGSSRGMRTGGADSTDDLGQFRVYGLAPGDYAVVAEARANTFVQPNAPPETEEDKVGYMTSFYPGTADEAAAQKVRVRGGGETPGIEIRVVSGRLFRISGMVTDSKGGAARVSGQVSKRMSGGAQNSFGFSTDEQGRFQMKNVPPGNYRLTVRQNQSGPRNPDGSPAEPGEFANMPIVLNGDLENILVVTNPGATITGQIVYEHGPPQPQPNQTAPPVVRVNATIGDPTDNMGMQMPQPAVVGPDLTFTMKGLMGEMLLRANAPMQYLKSVTVNGTDITDTPREFKPGDRVTITLSSRASTVEGTVTDSAGAPVTDAGLILFSDDKASWRSNSIKTRRSNIDQAGHYRMTGLLPGRYFIIAVPRERLNVNMGMMDAAMFEELSKEATSLVVGDDEQRQVDLKFVAGSGGH